MSDFKYMDELDKKIENINYKNELNKIEEQLNRVIQSLADPKYEGVNEKYKFLNNNLQVMYNRIKKYKGYTKTKDTPETFYNNFVTDYNKNIKDKLEKAIREPQTELMLKYLNEIKGLLQPIENKQPKTEPEPEQTVPEQTVPEQTVPEQQEPEAVQPVPTNPTFPKGKALNERITRQNPDAPPITTTTPTPTLDDFTKPKPEPEEQQREQQQEPEEEEEQPEQNQTLVPINTSQQIVQTPNQNFQLIKRDIDELKNNSQLDIIKGVGDIIEFVATSNLTDEMTDEVIDQMLTLKDSHGNLLFNNRFQIEDLIRTRNKGKRLKYLLPKRNINAEKPDEQKLIINPMLRRGRIASMTSAKERYYNYI